MDYQVQQALLAKAFWRNSGICYSRAKFAEEADAIAFSNAVKATGETVNGGMFHGKPLGSITKYADGWEVDY